VSSATGATEIFGGANMTNFGHERSTIAGAKLFAGVVATARRILQHGCESGSFCLAGLE